MVILAEGGLTTPLGDVRPALGVRPRPRDGRGRRQRRGRRRRGRTSAARPRLGHRPAAGRGASPRPTPRRCSQCCAGCRCPGGWRGRWRPSRASTTPRRSSLVVAGRRAATGRPHPWWSPRCCGLRAGRGRGGRASRSASAGRGLLRRVALPSPGSTRWPRSRSACSPSPRRRCCTRSGFLAVYLCGAGPRQRRGCRTARQLGVRRGHGVARPDRAVRAARPARLARPAAGAVGARARGRRASLLLVARPLSVVAAAGVVPGAVARAGLPVLGRPARRGADRAGDHPAQGGCPGATSSSTSSSCWSWSSPGPGPDPAVGGPAAAASPRRRRRATSRSSRRRWTSSRRPAAGDRSRRGSRLHGVYLAELRLPAGAAVTPGRARRAASSPTGTTRLRARRPGLLVVAHGAVAAGGRAPAAGGQPARAAWPAGGGGGAADGGRLTTGTARARRRPGGRDRRGRRERRGGPGVPPAVRGSSSRSRRSCWSRRRGRASAAGRPSGRSGGRWS